MFKQGLKYIQEPYRGLINELLKSLKEILGDNLISLSIFGSVARGEARVDSDIDLLIIAKELPSSRIKRVEIFESVEDKLQKYIDKLYDEGIYTYFSPIILTCEEASKVPPIFLDMVEDSILIYDKDKFLENLLKKIYKRLQELGAERVWMGRKWYWRLKKDYKPGEAIIIE